MVALVVPNFASSTEDRVSGGQRIEGSLLFDSGSSQYLKKTFSSAGDRQINTVSFWMKRYSADDAYQRIFNCDTGATSLQEIVLNDEGGADSDNLVSEFYVSSQSRIKTNALLRDTSGWYHVVVVFNSPDATQADRQIIYINGERQTLNNSVSVAQDAEGMFGSANEHRIGRGNNYAINYNGALSNFYFVDGQALEPSYFGFTDPLTNTWRPKKFSGDMKYAAASGTLASQFSNTAIPTYANEDGGSENSATWPNWVDGDASTYTNMTYLTDHWSKMTFQTAISNVTKIVIGYDGAAFCGYNGSASYHVGYAGSRQSVTLYDSSAITLTNLYFISKGGMGVAYLYDCTVTVGGTDYELTWNDPTNINSFYLPFDGSAAIGKDQSGNGNHWTPVNFGCSTNIEKATGGVPILNTVNGGNWPTVGPRADSLASSCVLAIPGVGNVNDYSATIKGSGSNKSVTNNGVTFPTTKYNFYGSAIYSDGSSSAFQVGSSTESDFAFAAEFTWEMWWYPISSGATTHARAWYFGTAEDDGGGAMHWYTSGNVNMLGGGAGGATSPLGPTDICTGTVRMDTWNHIAVTRDSANKVRVFLNGVESGSTTNTNPVSSGQRTFYVGGPSYESAQYWQDIRFYDGVCKYASDFNPASTKPDIRPSSPTAPTYRSYLEERKSGSILLDGSGDYLSFADSDDFDLVASGTGDFTIEMWIHPTANSGNQYILESNTDGTRLMYNGSSGRLHLNNPDDSFLMETSAISSAWAINGWHHIAFVKSSSTGYIFYDGVQYAFHSGPTLGGNLNFNDLHIGHSSSSGLVGYISNVRIVKGTAVYTSDFTPPTSPLTSITNTKLLCCNSATSSTAYTTSPGAITANGGVTVSGSSAFNTDGYMAHGRSSGCYSTFNPLYNWGGGGDATLSEGNLRALADAQNSNAISSFPVESGKWYFEVEMIKLEESISVGQGTRPGNSACNRWVQRVHDRAYAEYYDGSGWNQLSAWTAYTDGDYVSCVTDVDNGTIEFWVNGKVAKSGGTFTPPTKATGPIWLGDGQIYNTDDDEVRINFGQFPFKYTPPAGYQPLAVSNTVSTECANPTAYVTPTLWTGTGGTDYLVNTGFQPDMTWIKQTNGAAWWANADSVRGAGKLLSINDGMAQADDSDSATAFSGFNYNGFYVGSVGGWYTNTLNDPYISYNWKAGGNKGTWNKDGKAYASAAAAGLDGGSTSPAGSSVGTKQGFSILQWTATGSNLTISHGLTAAPQFMILKNVSVTSDYWTYHVGVNKGVDPEDYYLTMNEGTAMTDDATAWQDTKPSSTLLTIGANYNIANTGNTIMAYCWHDVPGLQKFGWYEGNGDANGPYIFLGFRPALVWYKKTSSGTENWQAYDNKLNTYNPTNQRMRIDLPNAKDTGNACDFLSDGFKIRNSDSADNTSTACYVYCAWAAEPTHNLYNSQSTAI